MDLFLPFSLSFLIALFLIPLTIYFAKKWGLIDDPQKHDHPAVLHKKPLPRGAGIPIFIAIFIAALVFIPFEKHLWGLLLGALIMVIDGTLDDKFDLHPLIRFAFQFLAAGVVVLSGVGISHITNPLGGVIRLDIIDIPIYFLGEHHLFLLADLLAFIWIVWTMNMVNWSSGVDGQMPGFVIIAAGCLAFLSSSFLGYDPSQEVVIKICMTIIGATLAFLIFNWHPAKILPGDSASMLLGFMLAVLAIFSGGKIATAILVLGIPTLDALYVFGRRIYHKKLPIWGDKTHLHHKLLNLGLSQRQVALFYWVVTGILGVITLSSSGKEKLFLFFFAAGFLAFLLIIIGALSPRQPKT